MTARPLMRSVAICAIAQIFTVATPASPATPRSRGAETRFIGLVEAAAGDLRVAVLRIGSRVCYGRKGDIVGGRYRLLGFTEDAAQVFDLNDSTTRMLAMGLP